jgi:hypothetical protein
MKVFLVGSKKGVSSANQLDFEDFFKALGASLAQAGHSLIINSGSLSTADPYAIDGANTYHKKTTVYLIRPDVTSLLNQDIPLHPYLNESLHPNINFIKETAKSSFRSSHLMSIDRADVIVAVGGSNGTISVIYTADALRKPIIIIPSFGGASEEAWRDFKGNYTNETMTLLQGQPATLKAQTATIVSHMVSYKRVVDRKKISSVASLSILVVSLLLASICWLSMLNGWLQQYVANKAFVQALVIISTNTIGLGLRYLMTISNVGNDFVEVKKPMIEWGIGNILSIVLFFIALFAGTTIAEKEVANEAFSSNTNAFMALSAIGFLCSMFTEKASKKVVSSMG